MAVRESSNPGEVSGRVLLTSEGRTWLRRRLDELRNEDVPRLRRYIETQEDDGLLRSEYERAQEQIRHLSSILRNADELTDTPPIDSVQLGDELEIHSRDGQRDRLRIVHPIEAPMDERRISSSAPLAKAALGRRPGDVVHVRTPDGDWEYRLLEWAVDNLRRRMLVESARL